MIDSPNPHRVAALAGTLLLAGWLAIAGPAVARADDVSPRDGFYAQLSAPMQSIVDGKSFRDGLEGIASQADLNLWIDRMVDPTAPIEAGPVGPTVLAAMEKLAAQRDCVVMPVANVLLVGRPQWVDRTAATVLSLKLSGDAAIAEIGWDDLTTPSEALTRSVSPSGGVVEVDPALPHDLWAAKSWKRIDRRVAVALVLAQFDRKPQSTSSLNKIRSSEATSSGTFTRRYSQGESAAAIREAIRQADPRGRVRAGGGWLTATGTVQAHRAAAAAMLRGAGKVAAADPDKDTFTLKLKASADSALHRLAQTANRKCVIEPNAQPACETVVSIEGENVTLRKLIDMVAAQVGVVATWRGDTITISLKK